MTNTITQPLQFAGPDNFALQCKLCNMAASVMSMACIICLTAIMHRVAQGPCITLTCDINDESPGFPIACVPYKFDTTVAGFHDQCWVNYGWLGKLWMAVVAECLPVVHICMDSSEAAKMG
jgi:hypothetical protein